jgi:hypothetical protein
MCRGALFSVALFLSFLSCSKTSDEDPDKPYRADVVAFSRVGDETQPPRFSLATREFPTMTSLEKMRGPYLRLRYGGVMRLSAVEGSIVKDASFSGAVQPQLRYKIKNGVVVPSDYQTLAMLSAYYQFETILASLEAKVGLAPSALLAKQKRGYLEVLFEPRIELETDEISATQLVKRNAAFVPGQGQFVLFERSATEKVPLAVNLQVLSHEFGHALFDYSFFDGDEEDVLLDNEAVSGLNEGFADFFSFLMVGSTDILGSSLFGSSLISERNFSSLTFDRSNYKTECHGKFYCLGTLFANALYKTRNSVGAADSGILNRNLLASVKAARAALAAKGITEESSEEEVLGAFSGAFVSSLGNASTALVEPLCTTLAANFNLDFTEGVCAP